MLDKVQKLFYHRKRKIKFSTLPLVTVSCTQSLFWGMPRTIWSIDGMERRDDGPSKIDPLSIAWKTSFFNAGLPLKIKKGNDVSFSARRADNLIFSGDKSIMYSGEDGSLTLKEDGSRIITNQFGSIKSLPHSVEFILLAKYE